MQDGGEGNQMRNHEKMEGPPIQNQRTLGFNWIPFVLHTFFLLLGAYFLRHNPILFTFIFFVTSTWLLHVLFLIFAKRRKINPLVAVLMLITLGAGAGEATLLLVTVFGQVNLSEAPISTPHIAATSTPINADEIKQVHATKGAFPQPVFIEPHDSCGAAKLKILGYGPHPTTRTCIRTHESKIVAYVYGEDGFRVSTPQAHRNSRDSCQIFLGGSFTFGEGLNWEETLPGIYEYTTQKCSQNLGWPGWGPHQSLALLQFNLVDLSLPVDQCIISTAPWHIPRIAGLTEWDRYGPKYEREGESLSFKGQFRTRESMSNRLLSILSRSALLKPTIMKFSQFQQTIENSDVQNYVEIISTLAEFCQSKLRAKVIIVFWDELINPNEYAGFSTRDITTMTQNSLPTNTRFIKVSSIFDLDDPSIRTEDKHHPNRRANALIIKEILRH